MINEKIKSLVDRALGQTGTLLQNGNDVKYFCPFCYHKNKKLQIDLNTDSDSFGFYSCWVCKNTKNSTGKSLFTLFNKIKVSSLYQEELKSLLDLTKIRNLDGFYNNLEPNKKTEYLQLPRNYIPLWKKTISPDRRHALNYLIKERKLTCEDIFKYKIGYCEEGEYKNKVIIPSFDSYGDLNYYIGRNIYDGEFGNYKNPNWSKNIIGFEIFINWNLPVILVEGVFDAITVKRNVIPLFGKNISNRLKLSIINNKVKDLYIALDLDAIKDSISIIESFIGYNINTYIVDLEDKDPAKMGYQQFHELLHKTEKMTFSKLIKYKILSL